MPLLSELTCLQRVRFGQLSTAAYASEEFFRKEFDAARWQREGRSCYWSLTRSSKNLNFEGEGVRLAPGQALDANSFFNSFYAGWWHHLTTVRTLCLRLQLAGSGRVQIYGATIGGGVDLLLERHIDALTNAEFDFALPATALQGRFLRLSFALLAKTTEFRLCGGGWLTSDVPPAAVALSIVTPTFRRPHFARRTVSALLQDAGVAQVLRRIILVEQTEAAELGDLEGERCRWIHQPNYGCAGGCARGLYEITQEPAHDRSTHFLLLDDDIMMEVDSVLRVARMAQYASRKVVLGGAMLDLFRPSRLVALAESIEPVEGGFHDIVQDYTNADVARPATLDYVSVGRPEGYCAWWFCFAPRALLDAVGLPWPGFLRWDDINYGLRAAAAGFTSYPAPGVAVWHVPFYSKSAAWTVYFDRYNKLIENALLGEAEAERCLVLLLRDALVALQSDDLGFAAACTLAASHYLAGWTHYRERTFPDFLGAVKTFIAAHEQAADRPAAGTSLIRLLQETAERHGAASAVHREFAELMPSAYTEASWRDYFERGNLTGGDRSRAPSPDLASVAG